MNSTSIFKVHEFTLIQNQELSETFILHQHEVCEFNFSLQTWVFVVIMYLLVQTVGNFLLFCVMTYEKFGMDSQKRSVTNQLLTSMCGMLISANLVLPTIRTINIGLQSKTCKWYLVLPKAYFFIIHRYDIGCYLSLWNT